MVLESLFAGQFQRYFDELLSRTMLWLFQHVPKTAGSSLNGELVPILSPSHHIFIDYTALDRLPFDVLLDESVGRFIALASERRYAYCTGHILSHHVERIAHALGNVRPITLLRDPVARFVSDFRYQSSPMNTGHAAFRAAYPTIEDYLELPGEWNKIAAHLLPQRLMDGADVDACIGHVMSNYALVGIQESYPLYLRLITTLAGSPRRPGVFKRVNTPTAETEVVLSQDTEARIRRCNELDIALYNAFATRFDAVAEGLEAYLELADPLP